MHDNGQTIAAAPTWTTILDAESPVTAGLISCVASSANPMKYRFPELDASASGATLQPGETFPFGRLGAKGITQVQAQGVGGTATGGVEVQEF